MLLPCSNNGQHGADDAIAAAAGEIEQIALGDVDILSQRLAQQCARRCAAWCRDGAVPDIH